MSIGSGVFPSPDPYSKIRYIVKRKTDKLFSGSTIINKLHSSVIQIQVISIFHALVSESTWSGGGRNSPGFPVVAWLGAWLVFSHKGNPRVSWSPFLSFGFMVTSRDSVVGMVPEKVWTSVKSKFIVGVYKMYKPVSMGTSRLHNVKREEWDLGKGSRGSKNRRIPSWCQPGPHPVPPGRVPPCCLRVSPRTYVHGEQRQKTNKNKSDNNNISAHNCY